MIKYYCDECVKEIKGRIPVNDRISNIIQLKNSKVKLEIIAGVACKKQPVTINSGHICVKCLRKAVNEAIDKYNEKEVE